MFAESYEQTSLKRPELSVTPMSPFMARLHGIDNTGQLEDIMGEFGQMLSLSYLFPCGDVIQNIYITMNYKLSLKVCIAFEGKLL